MGITTAPRIRFFLGCFGAPACRNLLLLHVIANMRSRGFFPLVTGFILGLWRKFTANAAQDFLEHD